MAAGKLYVFFFVDDAIPANALRWTEMRWGAIPLCVVAGMGIAARCEPSLPKTRPWGNSIGL